MRMGFGLVREGKGRNVMVYAATLSLSLYSETLSIAHHFIWFSCFVQVVLGHPAVVAEELDAISCIFFACAIR